MANWSPLRYALLLSWVAAASGGPWPQFRGPNGSGIDSDLGEEIHATPALTRGRIYVRTRSLLYCFGAAE